MLTTMTGKFEFNFADEGAMTLIVKPFGNIVTPQCLLIDFDSQSSLLGVIGTPYALLLIRAPAVCAIAVKPIPDLFEDCCVQEGPNCVAWRFPA